MAPSTRGAKNGVNKKTSRTATRVALPQARVLLRRIANDTQASATWTMSNESVVENNQEVSNEPEDLPAPVLRRSARRGRPTRGMQVTTRNTSPETVPTSPEPTLVPINESSVAVEPVPVTPEQRNEVAIVDLVTPGPATLPPTRSLGQPLEVDLTCELDDEVFVLLEDFVNPSRRPNTGSQLPVLLGASPQRVRNLLPSRNFRRHYAGSLSEALPLLSDLRGHSLPIDLSLGAQSSTPKTTESSSQEHQETSERIQCPICLDTLDQIKAANKRLTSTTCGHLFCGPCIKQAIIDANQCPTCRRTLDMKKIHPIFI